MKRLLKWLCAVIVIFGALTVWTLWGNTAPVLTQITVSSAVLPHEFDGFRIVQISDLHNAGFIGEVAALAAEAQPDIIVFTGDIVDANHTDTGIALKMAELAVEIAPCYYVTGNHESWVGEYTELETGLIELGVIVLHNEKLPVEKNGAEILIVGVDDPVFMNNGWEVDDDAALLRPILRSLTAGEDGFVLLLSHRPELFGLYAETGIELVVSGHVHGGQFRLPLVGGLYGPDQGVFPEYDAGLYTDGATNMVVSRGIGNSVFPVRFNNRPEVVLIELKAE